MARVLLILFCRSDPRQDKRVNTGFLSRGSEVSRTVIPVQIAAVIRHGERERNSSHRLFPAKATSLRPCPPIFLFPRDFCGIPALPLQFHGIRFTKATRRPCAATTRKATHHPERTTERLTSRFAAAIPPISTTRQTGIFHHGEVLLQILRIIILNRVYTAAISLMLRASQSSVVSVQTTDTTGTTGELKNYFLTRTKDSNCRI